MDKKKPPKPLLSIVTIVLNGESYISETLDSIINQIDSRCEYIVIDGGSSDSTLQIINQYKESIDLIISNASAYFNPTSPPLKIANAFIFLTDLGCGCLLISFL